MGTTIMGQPPECEELLRRAGSGDQEAMAILFAQCRDRLEQVVSLRMDRRLQGRIDPGDVLQESFLDAVRRVPEFARAPTTSVYLWLRFLTLQKLVDLTRRHLGSKMRGAGQEISIYRGSLPQASSVSLAAQLLGHFTSPSHAVIRAETQLQVQEALNAMDPIDREVLALRHFELLSNNEVAAVLDLSKAAASNRYVRALKRMKEILSAVPARRAARPGESRSGRR
jgi:RNA polymerase sigma-70 factor, ECF subfamily